ncbi:hypothetical protein CEJ42_13820 [Herbaspirillum robiniae]|uniref:Uncharacterized protein n=1 Tax=Herbaspirillum robiniae TaxID=2014887 RepID=A0A246WPP5_9BURK|nr:hypothetical protein CEJ42_13820 [Herbaspirillum robiniae]
MSGDAALLARASSGCFFADGENRAIIPFPCGNMLVASVVRLVPGMPEQAQPASFSLFPLPIAMHPGQ